MHPIHVRAFDITFGLIHPEYFVTADGEMYFGEVAYRPPGFKAFRLFKRACGFNPYQASMLVFDPKSTKEEVDAFFPREVVDAHGYPGCFGVYPQRRVVSKLEMPKKTIEHPYFESHKLVAPAEDTVPDRPALGTQRGLIFFFADDLIKMRDLLKAQSSLVSAT